MRRQDGAEQIDVALGLVHGFGPFGGGPGFALGLGVFLHPGEQLDAFVWVRSAIHRACSNASP